MPIKRDQFDAIGDEEEATTSELIVTFLYESHDQAFTRGEIADEINRDPDTVATNLTRLKNRGLVEHKDQYWAITDDRDRLADAIQFSDALTGLNDRFGPLIEDETDAQAWAEAQPDRPHPSERDGGEIESHPDEATKSEQGD